MRTALALGLSLLALALAGCGGDDGDGGDDSSGTIAEAKQALVDDCHEGNEGDERDLALCRCIADQLQSKHGYDTPAKFDEARKRVADEDVPREVRDAVSSPECQATRQ